MLAYLLYILAIVKHKTSAKLSGERKKLESSSSQQYNNYLYNDLPPFFVGTEDELFELFIKLRDLNKNTFECSLQLVKLLNHLIQLITLI